MQNAIPTTNETDQNTALAPTVPMLLTSGETTTPSKSTPTPIAIPIKVGIMTRKLFF